MKEISVPRYYGSDIDKTKTELQTHQAYGSVSYIRTVDKDTCNVAFVIRKFRSAHLRTTGISIPKLELQAEVIAIRPKVKLIQECNLKVSKSFFVSQLMRWTELLRLEKTPVKWLVLHTRKVKDSDFQLENKQISNIVAPSLNVVA